MSTEQEEVWEEWFESQFWLTDQIQNTINRMSAGKDDQFRAALWSAVIEDAAEQLRMYVVPLRKPTEAVPDER